MHMEDLGRIDAVITDLDGTLVELRIEYIQARKEAIKKLESIHPFPKHMFSTRDSLFQIYDRSVKLLSARHRISLIPEVKKILINIADKYEMDAAKRTQPLPRVLVCLGKLQDIGIEMVLLTASGKKTSDHVLRKFNMHDFFKRIFTRESMFNIKQYPDFLPKALKKAGIEPKRSLVVGDSVSDILCGKTINAMTVGVTSGMSKPKELAQSGADYIMDSFPQILVLLRAG